MTSLSRRSFLIGLGTVAAASVTLPAVASPVKLSALVPASAKSQDRYVTLPAVASPVKLSALVPASAKSQDRYVTFYNQHTGESFEGLYRYGDQYIGASLHEINRVMRDFRTNGVTEMDPRLIDILSQMQQLIYKKGGDGSYELISGYRSKKTNDMLRARGEGVAKNSYHIQGKAADIRLKNFPTREIHKIALDLKAGGVGMYRASDFVHVDSGPVRTW